MRARLTFAVFLTFFLLIGLTGVGLAQQFAHATYPNLGPGRAGMANLPDGSTAKAFQTEIGGGELHLAKVDACDQVIWSKRLAIGKPMGKLLGMAAWQENIYLALTLSKHSPADTLLLLKTNAQGQVLWAEKISGPKVFWYNLSVNDRGDIYLNGNTQDPNYQANIVIKIASGGSILWSNAYTSSQIWGMGVPDHRGGFLRLTGRTAYLLDANGSPQWIRMYDAGYQSLVPPLFTQDGFVVFAANPGGPGSAQAFKIDLQGQVLWSSPRFLNGSFSDAVLLASGEILCSSNGTGPSLDQLQLSWLSSASGTVSRSKWIKPEPTPVLATALTETAWGDLLALSQSALGSGTQVEFLRIAPTLNGTAECTWRDADYETGIAPVTVLANPTLPQKQAVPFVLTPANAFLQPSPIFLTEGCSNKTEPQTLHLGGDTLLCPGQALLLSPKPELQGTYTWNTGHQSKELEVAEPGKYWLEVETSCGDTHYSDTLELGFFPADPLKIASGQNQYAWGTTAELYLQNQVDTTVHWYASTGDSSRGNSWSLPLLQAGDISVKACYSSPDRCVLCDSLQLRVRAPQLHLPDAFTPNGDGLNDTFGPPGGALHHFDLYIKDRYGKVLAHCINRAWNGRVKDQRALGGVYLYELSYQIYPEQPPQILRGYFTLML